MEASVTPSIGRIVHYVSHGTPGGEYPSTCRAAIVTAVDTYQPSGPDGEHIGHVSLCVLNPDGMFFNRAVLYHDGAETPGDPNCEGLHAAGPLRYCQCGWMEASYKGGTWHWPERIPTATFDIHVASPADPAGVGRAVVEGIAEYEGRRGDGPKPRT